MTKALYWLDQSFGWVYLTHVEALACLLIRALVHSSKSIGKALGVYI